MRHGVVTKNGFFTSNLLLIVFLFLGYYVFMTPNNINLKSTDSITIYVILFVIGLTIRIMMKNPYATIKIILMVSAIILFFYLLSNGVTFKIADKLFEFLSFGLRDFHLPTDLLGS